MQYRLARSPRHGVHGPVLRASSDHRAFDVDCRRASVSKQDFDECTADRCLQFLCRFRRFDLYNGLATRNELPSALSHRAIVPSSMPMPDFGKTSLVAMNTYG